jgi:hypothetical protein
MSGHKTPGTDLLGDPNSRADKLSQSAEIVLLKTEIARLRAHIQADAIWCKRLGFGKRHAEHLAALKEEK